MRFRIKFAFFVIWYSLLCTMGLQILRFVSGADWEGAGFHHFRLGHIRRRDWGRFIGVFRPQSKQMDALAPDPPGWESQHPISLSASLEIDATLGSWRVRLSSSSWWALRERRNQRERRLFKFDRSSSEEVCLKKNLLNPSRFDLKIIRELYREIIGEKMPLSMRCYL